MFTGSVCRQQVLQTDLEYGTAEQALQEGSIMLLILGCLALGSTTSHTPCGLPCIQWLESFCRAVHVHNSSGCCYCCC